MDPLQLPPGSNGDGPDHDDDDVATGIIVPPPEPRPPWERQEGEPGRAYHGFCHFRDLKVRGAAPAWRNHKRDCEHEPVADHADAPKRWRLWSVEWAWVARAAKWDAEVDRQFREKSVKDQIEARERHARLAQATLSVLTVPVRAALEAAKDPLIVQRLTEHMKYGPAHTMQVLGAVARLAAVIPMVVGMERLALGMSTEALEIEDLRDTGFADRILSDPQATDLAIALLDRLSRSSTSPALGAGSPSEPGEVAPSSPFEPPDEEIS